MPRPRVIRLMHLDSFRPTIDCQEIRLDRSLTTRRSETRARTTSTSKEIRRDDRLSHA
jgi:hypothetical protein